MVDSILRSQIPDDALALVDGVSGTEWTYGAVKRAVGEAAGALKRAGRRLVFCSCASDPATVIGYLAAASAGHVVAMLDATLPEARWQALLEAYRPDFVLGQRPPAPGARETGLGPAGLVLQELAGAGAGPLHGDLGLLLSTSGTTGSPKFVRLAWKGVEANARSIATSLGIDGRERALANLPLHYSYGLSVLNSHLAAGAAVVLTPAGVLEPAFWEAATAFKATSMAGVPYTYEMLARLDPARRLPPEVRTLTQAGGRLAPLLVERFHGLMQARGGRFFVMYGQTEATARMACMPPDRLAGKTGAVGMAIPGGRFSIERDAVAVADGDEGEIVYRGPNVMMGYATSRDDLARADELGGVLHTGDVGRLDAEGFLWVTGRTKRIAKVFGLRINLDEVEGLVRRYGPAAVICRQDRLRVAGEFGQELELESIRRELAGALRVHHTGIEVIRLERLPLTPNGKTDYAALERQA